MVWIGSRVNASRLSDPINITRDDYEETFVSDFAHFLSTWVAMFP